MNSFTCHFPYIKFQLKGKNILNYPLGTFTDMLQLCEICFVVVANLVSQSLLVYIRDFSRKGEWLKVSRTTIALFRVNKKPILSPNRGKLDAC